MSKKKICFVTALPGSARSFLTQPIATLKPYFEIHYIGNFNSDDEVADLNVDKAISFPIERKPNIKADIKALWLLYRHFRKEKYFAVHAITRKATLLAGLASFLARTPHRIKTFTGQIWATMSGKKRRFYQLLDRLDVKINTELLVDGESQRQFLISNKIMKDEDASVLAHGSICGIDTTRFSSNIEIRSQLRESLGYSESDVVFIFLGRLKREKGIYELFEAFDELASEHKNAKLLLVGNDEENCEGKISNYKNIKKGINTIFYGPTPKPEEIFQAADIFVLPTHREGFGLAALEAAAVGLPTICSDAYGVMDAMEDNITGLRSHVKDSHSLLISMEYLLNDENLRKNMGMAGKERVKNKFSRKIVCDAWLEFYKSLD